MEQVMPRWQGIRVGGSALAALIAAMAVTGAAAQDSASQTPVAGIELPVDQVEAIVRDYLMREPEVIYQALQELQRREAVADAERRKATLAARQDDLFHNASTPVAGNRDGDVTLVEFFDYRCGYCRRVVDSMRSLVERDENLRVVFKEFPILGEDSVRASRAALAADRQGLYLPLHFALMAADDLSMEGIMQAAAGVGLDTEQLATDMQSPDIQAEIGATYALARELGIEGTPAFVVGDELVPGAVSEERLASLIEAARTN
jgi:protein-disulfide isomerase